MFSKLSLALAVAVAGLVGMAAPQSASAQEYGNHYQVEHHVCTYKTIKTYVFKRVAFKKRVVRYYSCGTPYYVWKTFYKTIRVPVYKRIRTCCHH